LDIRKIKAENGGTDRFADAVPMVASAGDVVMANRQVLHGSFANTSSDLRVTINFGFHRRSSVIGVKREDGAIYDEEHIRARSRIIALAIDARRQRFPEETSFVYKPLVDDPDDTTWNEQTREQLLKNYQLLDLPL
ncbi:MAG TPA: phytanoyl-CoA dioxygenase, partial [Candidatus Latescibacteria bacterium]|nr:phytanoyl-CoA dioxygenase [Candidatus Latescibacterota bacterium]